jgi:excisionase family DNA binding protein
MTLNDLPPTISVERAGEVLGISRRSAYRAATTGELPTIRLGRRLLVPTARLLELLGLPSDQVGGVKVSEPA